MRGSKVDSPDSSYMPWSSFISPRAAHISRAGHVSRCTAWTVPPVSRVSVASARTAASAQDERGSGSAPIRSRSTYASVTGPQSGASAG
jgi:hypothetical protein